MDSIHSKRARALEYGHYRTISLMSHALKILFKVLLNRIKPVLHFEINECSMGLFQTKGSGTQLSSSVCCVNVVLKLTEKLSFDTVQQILFGLMSYLDFVDKDLRPIQKVYFNQQEVAKHDNEFSDPVPICRGVRHRCVLSLILFSYYSEVILRVVDKLPRSRRWNSRNKHSLRR